MPFPSTEQDLFGPCEAELVNFERIFPTQESIIVRLHLHRTPMSVYMVECEHIQVELDRGNSAGLHFASGADPALTRELYIRSLMLQLMRFLNGRGFILSLNAFKVKR